MLENEIKQFIDENEWIYAKSMPRTPHEYVLERNAVNYDRYFDFINHIDVFGYDQYFFKMKFRYFNVGDYKYWALFIRGNERIINRARL